MEKLKGLFLKYKEIITYIIVGGVTTLVRWGTTTIFEKILIPCGLQGVTLSVLVTGLSLIVTILFAFPPNKLIVFESKSFRKGIIGKEFVAFISARAAASLIELVGVPAISGIFSIPTLITTMFVSVIVLVINYIFSKVFIFKDREGKKDTAENSKNVKSETRAKDKVISGMLMTACLVVAVVSISFFVVEAVTVVISNWF